MIKGDYPVGAKDRTDAPYNEPMAKMREFPVVIATTMVKHTKVNVHSVDENPSDGHINYAWEKQHIGIKELLEELKKYVCRDYDSVGVFTPNGRYLRKLLNEIEGWEVEETIIEME